MSSADVNTSSHAQFQPSSFHGGPTEPGPSGRGPFRSKVGESAVGQPQLPRCDGCGQPLGYWAIDKVTGLLDRWGLDDQAPALLELAAQHRRLVAVFLVDLDHFKRINDTMGHLAGDRALQAVAGVLRAVSGPDDVVGRFGGDEFVMLAPAPSLWHALALGRRIRTTIRDLGGDHHEPRGAHLACTASVGIACRVPVGGSDLSALLSDADAALLAAKRQGRDRACVADPAGGSDAHRLEQRYWIMDPPALDLRRHEPGPEAVPSLSAERLRRNGTWLDPVGPRSVTRVGD